MIKLWWTKGTGKKAPEPLLTVDKLLTKGSFFGTKEGHLVLVHGDEFVGEQEEGRVAIVAVWCPETMRARLDLIGYTDPQFILAVAKGHVFPLDKKGIYAARYAVLEHKLASNPNYCSVLLERAEG